MELDLTSTVFWVAVGQIILIDIVLSGSLTTFAIFAWRTGKVALSCQALALIDTLLAIRAIAFTPT